MYRYTNLLELRKNVNSLYEDLKILQIFVDAAIEHIPQTITEKIYDITNIIDNCLIIHSKLKFDVLNHKELPNKRKKIADFNEIKVELQEILTCLYFLKLATKNDYKELSYEEIFNMLDILLKKSEYIINLANKTKLKIYPNEKSKTKSAVKDFDLSKSEMAPKNVISIRGQK